MSQEENTIPQSEEDKVASLVEEATEQLPIEEQPKEEIKKPKKKTSFVDPDKFEAEQAAQKTQVPEGQVQIENPAITIMKLANAQLQATLVLTKAVETNTKAYEKMALEIEMSRKVNEQMLEFFKSLTKKPLVQPSSSYVAPANIQTTASSNVAVPSNSTVKKEISPNLKITTTLKKENPNPTPQPPTPIPATTTPTTTQPVQPQTSTSPTSLVDKVRMKFPEELESRLAFDGDTSSTFVIIKPKQFIGSENFAKVASTVRGSGGEYISAGKDSHFRIPKSSIK